MKTDPSKFIPNSESAPEQWIIFHKALKSWFSKTEANAQFTKFWNQRAGAGSPADTHDVRAYMEDEGVDLQTTTSGEITDSAFGVFDWFKSAANWLRGIIIGALIVGILLIAFVVVQITRKGLNVKGSSAPPLTPGLPFKALPAL